MGHCHAVGGAGAGQANDVLASDVAGEDRGTDDEPAKVAAREEVVIGRVLGPQDHPYCQTEEDDEVAGYSDPVNYREVHRIPFVDVMSMNTLIGILP